MIWVIVAVLALLVAVCIYQIRELTSRINNTADTFCRTIAVCERINETVNETATLAKDTGEAIAILNGKVSNNEHRIRDIYKSINQLKGWPNNEVEYRS